MTTKSKKTTAKKATPERVTIRVPKGTPLDDLLSIVRAPNSDQRVWITTKALKFDLLVW